MRCLLTVAAGLGLILAGADALTTRQTATSSEKCFGGTKLCISATVQGSNARIQIKLTGANGAWGAFGIGSGMVGADIYLAKKPAAGNLDVGDYSASSKTTPTLDATQSITLDTAASSYDSASNTLTAIFTRPLAAGTSSQALTPAADQDFVWAYGTLGNDGTPSYHSSNKGTFTGNFFISATSVTPTPTISSAASLTPTISPSTSITPTISPSTSITPTVSPSGSPSKTPSSSPTASLSIGASPSTSASISVSPAAPSPSSSAAQGSPSISASIKASPSVSASVSAAASSSRSPSPTPSPPVRQRCLLQDPVSFCVSAAEIIGTQNVRITFEVGSYTVWAALGLGLTMDSSDVFLAYVEGKTIRISDRFSTGHELPALDASQDLKIVSGTKINGDGSWKISFLRPLKPNDSKDFELLSNQSRSFIWAVGGLSSDGTPQYHGKTKGVYIGNIFTEKPINEGQANVIDTPGSAVRVSSSILLATFSGFVAMCFALL